MYQIRMLENGALPYAFNGEFHPEDMSAPYSALNEAAISDYPWKAQYPDSFPAFARVGWNEDGLFVLMYANENPIRKLELEWGTTQCCDSCMEFFVCPFPDTDERYLNIEVNPAGVAHVGLGTGRHERRVWHAPVPGMDIAVSRHEGGFWAVSYRIPASLLTELYGRKLEKGLVMKGNFYKCSEKIHPHFGSWNHVETAKPDFHRPEFFAEITLL